MKMKRITSLLLLAFFTVAMLGGMFQAAQAQTAAGEEEDVGVGQVFKSAKYDKEKGAKPWQIWLAVGSIPVMIIVVKYL
jgi:hypothetical protein